MKLHDLRPADGAHRPKTRVGRGIAAGKGKTAGRGTKGQKARAGGSVPPWFEGGQTPLHMRIPKLRGFRNRFKVEYEIVNVGDISARVDAGAFSAAGTAPKKGEPLTINADVLRAVGLVRDVRKPLKVLGGGELSTALFVVADSFTKSATEKIQAAGGSVNLLEVPTESRPALGVDGASSATTARAESPKAETTTAKASTAEPTAAAATTSEPARKSRGKSAASRPSDAGETDEPAPNAAATASGDASATADASGSADASATADASGSADASPEDAASGDEGAGSSDGPAEEPDAVEEGSTERPVTGDESETDTAAPADDA
jgi:large subunit ribosomal protein L15